MRPTRGCSRVPVYLRPFGDQGRPPGEAGGGPSRQPLGGMEEKKP